MNQAACKAFTLIELLAVIAIASLVLAFGMISLGNLSRHTEALSLVGGLRSMDARARLHARTSGNVVDLEVHSDSQIIRLVERAGDFDGLLAHRNISNRIALTIETSRGDGVVSFDRLGVSEDYALAVSDGRLSRRLAFAGLTGEVVVQETQP